MPYFKSWIATAAALILLWLIFPRPAYAYLDPGTGSYMLQLILAALLGAAFAVKVFWNDIKTFFRNLLAGKNAHEEAEE